MQTFTGKNYLKIDIASNFGLDKESWDDRLAWFEDHKNDLLSMMPKADTPALYFAGVEAWNQVEKGEAIGYPISLDATASGMQILACLTGDRKAAELCNVVNVGRRMDAYTALYQLMQEKVGEQKGRLTRAMVKEAVMTSFYASEAIPKKVFGEGPMLNSFYETVQENAPAAWELNEFYKSIWDADRETYSWVLPDNFHVEVKVISNVNTTVLFLGQHFDVVTKVHAPMAEGRSLSANTTHSIDGMIVREMVRRCNYDPSQIWYLRELLTDPTQWKEDASDENSEMLLTLLDHYKKSGYLSARVLDYIHPGNAHLVPVDDILALLESLPAKPFEVISIHDCFRCLPNYGNDLRKQYTLQLHLLAKSNMLSFILSQLMGHEVDISKLDETLADDILNAEYALS